MSDTADTTDTAQKTDSAAKRAVEAPALSVRHLHKQYKGAPKPVLDDISFDVPRGTVMVVLGPSGSGKSTLLRAVAGLEPIQGGEILLDGQVIDQGDPKRLTGRSPRPSSVRTQIGMVFQSYDLFPNKNVIDNITLAPVLVLKRDKSQARAEAMELLERVHLADRATAWPHELSGGQRQRVAICRALIEHPKVLLLDEITAALDPEMVREVLDVVLELAGQGQTMLLVTHEMRFARAIADRVMLLEDGGIVETSDDPEGFFTHPESERARQFLGTFEYSRPAHPHAAAGGEA